MNIPSGLKIVGIIISLVLVIWAVEDRYQTIVDAKDMQEQTVKTINQLQQNINKNADIRLYDELVQRKFLYKKLLEQNQNDIDLREEYQEIKDAIKRVKARLEGCR